MPKILVDNRAVNCGTTTTVDVHSAVERVVYRDADDARARYVADAAVVGDGVQVDRIATNAELLADARQLDVMDGRLAVGWRKEHHVRTKANASLLL